MAKSQHSKKYTRLLAALRQARERAGLTQLDVAKRLQTYSSYVSKCESGERRVDVIELAEFCKLYDVRLSAFLEAAGFEW